MARAARAASATADPLITAAGESVALAPKERNLALLTRIALNPLITSQEVEADDAVLVRDLFAREVLERGAATTAA